MSDIRPQTDVMVVLTDAEEALRRRRVARKIVRACAEAHDWPWEELTQVEKMLGLKGEI